MNEVVSEIATSLSVSNLWDTVGSIVPILAISVLFGLGYYLVKKIINKVKKAKGGI